MAEIQFWTLLNNRIDPSSGLGFYGASFGNSVAVGSYQNTTYITNAAGTTQGPLAQNVRWGHPSSGYLNSETNPTALTSIPNQNGSLEIRFTHGTAVRTQNTQVLIYDRYSTSNNASGVTTQMAELIHPNPTAGPGGSGDSVWQVCSGVQGTPVANTLATSPGLSGLSPNGPMTSSTQHSWYLALSASPDSIGSKTLYGLYCSLEYL